MKKTIKQKKLPLISVVMPVYNAQRYVAKALDSIITQTYSNWELIIVDDNSKDKTGEILRSYQKQYPKKIKVTFLRSNLNRGGDVAANAAIQKAKGKYIAKMDSDDIADSTRLEKQVAYLEAHSKVFMVGSNAYVINEAGQIVGEKKVPTGSKEIYREYIYFHPMIHPSVMFRNLFQKSDFYKIKYGLANDYYTFFALLCKGYKFVNLKEKLLYYRIDGKNSSLKNIKKGLIINMQIKLDIIQKYHYPLSAHAIVKNIALFCAGMILPQKISFYLYLISKGILRLSDLKISIANRFQTRNVAVQEKLAV